VRDDELMAVLRETAESIGVAFRTGVVDYRAGGDRADQYALDLVADEVAVRMLAGAGLGVLSEESGRHHPERELCVVVDPIDGSTNASRGIPWFATSLAVVDDRGVRAALVVNQASGVRYEAVRGGGATRDGAPIHVAAPLSLSDAMIAMNGYARRHFGWRQYRAFGAAALDLCLVAEGAIEGYLDCAGSNHGVWDYLGGMCILEEAGGVIADAFDRPLIVLEHGERRAPVAACAAGLLDELVVARRSVDEAAL
jgi:fructose-1,6-bisphosphatase/inositol monophosphatase family enzyme